MFRNRRANCAAAVGPRAAAVQRRRRQACTVRVREPSFRRAVETNPGSQIEILRGHRTGGHQGHRREPGRCGAAPFRRRHHGSATAPHIRHNPHRTPLPGLPLRRPGGRPSSSRLRIIDPLVQTERSSRPRPGVYAGCLCLTGGDLQRGPARPLGAPHRAGSSVTRNSRTGSRHTSMHWWVSCGMIPDSLIKVAQHVNQRRMRGAAGHFFHRKVVS